KACAGDGRRTLPGRCASIGQGCRSPETHALSERAQPRAATVCAAVSEGGRLWTHQLELTMAYFLVEIHDTHHPVASGLYYEDQRKEARRRAADFLRNRMPKFLGYFEGVLRQNFSGERYMLGAQFTYVDLSIFQVVAGLECAFPYATRKAARKYPRLFGLHSRIAERPRIAAYLASPRRIPFNNDGIFRHYPELDAARH